MKGNGYYKESLIASRTDDAVVSYAGVETEAVFEPEDDSSLKTHSCKQWSP